MVRFSLRTVVGICSELWLEDELHEQWYVGHIPPGLPAAEYDRINEILQRAPTVGWALHELRQTPMHIMVPLVA